MKNLKIYTVREERWNPQISYNKFHTGTLAELTEKLHIKTNSKTIDSLLNKVNKKTFIYGTSNYYLVEENELGYGFNGREKGLLRSAV
ncbi:MAG: hypothetical protein ACRCWI_02230 [Brevinema sp.]